MQKYLVGGAVRDKLLGLTPKDMDYVVTGETDESMMAKGFTPVGKAFGIYLHPQTKEQYALAVSVTSKNDANTEWYFHNAPNVELSDDLARRDITINAMAMDGEELVDLFGGIEDLQRKVIRMVAEENLWYDPLRVIRIARFAARYADFTIDPETIAVCRRISFSGRLSNLARERIWVEMEKGLMTEKPSVFINALRTLGVLRWLLPQVDALFGVPQTEKHHPEIDTGIHVMMVLDYAAAHGGCIQTRYAALCHDLGKGLTPLHILPAHHGHETVSAHLTEVVSSTIGAPGAISKTARKVAQFHTHIHTISQLRAATIVDMLSEMDIRRNERLIDIIANACIADARGRLGKEGAEYPQADWFRAFCHAFINAPVPDVVKDGVAPRMIPKVVRRNRITAVEECRRTLLAK